MIDDTLVWEGIVDKVKISISVYCMIQTLIPIASSISLDQFLLGLINISPKRKLVFT